MAAIALWSRTIAPGAELTLDQPMGVHITSASFDDSITIQKDDSKNRNIVKISFEQVAFDDDSDEENDEDDEDKVGEPVTAVLAHLFAGRVEYQVLDFTIPPQTTVIIKNTGSNAVCLLGNVLADEDDEYDQPPDFDDDFDSDDEDDVLGMDVDDEEDGASRFQEIKDEISAIEKPSSKKAAKKPESKKADKPESKKSEKPESKKATEIPANKKDGKKRPAPETDNEESPEKQGTETLSKNQKKKLAKKLKTEGGAATPAPESKANGAEKKEGGKKDKKNGVAERTLPSGLKIIDSKDGEGDAVANGKMIHVRYIGKLDNGKVFDKNTAGEPFKFRVGKGEVIKGWDQGFLGMKVGGERRLVIPAELAYGKKRAGDIPPNSTLTFDVKLLKIR